MIRWIHPRLGTAPATEVRLPHVLVDVRDLVDRDGNFVAEVAQKIARGVEALALGQTVVVGCDLGISRSNAVAAGILSRTKNLQFVEALRQVQQATGEGDIKVPLLMARAP